MFWALFQKWKKMPSLPMRGVRKKLRDYGDEFLRAFYVWRRISLSGGGRGKINILKGFGHEYFWDEEKTEEVGSSSKASLWI